MKHLLASVDKAFLRDWVEHGERATRPRDGLLAFVSARASTRTRTSVARAAQLLGLAFLEIPWTAFYGNPEVHEGARRLVRSELKSMGAAFVRAAVLRVDDQDLLEVAAGDAPPLVINGCTDQWHPLQSLADLRALRERTGALAGRAVAFVGNGDGPVAASLAVASAAVGCHVRIVGPYPPRNDVCRLTAALGCPVDYSTDPSAILGCVAVYADEWYYRALSDDERDATRPYRITPELLAAYAPDAAVMHCLPFGDEITPALLDTSTSLVWRQAALRAPALAAYVDYELEST